MDRTAQLGIEPVKNQPINDGTGKSLAHVTRRSNADDYILKRYFHSLNLLRDDDGSDKEHDLSSPVPQAPNMIEEHAKLSNFSAKPNHPGQIDIDHHGHCSAEERWPLGHFISTKTHSDSDSSYSDSLPTMKVDDIAVLPHCPRYGDKTAFNVFGPLAGVDLDALSNVETEAASEACDPHSEVKGEDGADQDPDKFWEQETSTTEVADNQSTGSYGTINLENDPDLAEMLAHRPLFPDVDFADKDNLPIVEFSLIAERDEAEKYNLYETGFFEREDTPFDWNNFKAPPLAEWDIDAEYKKEGIDFDNIKRELVLKDRQRRRKLHMPYEHRRTLTRKGARDEAKEAAKPQ